MSTKIVMTNVAKASTAKMSELEKAQRQADLAKAKLEALLAGKQYTTVSELPEVTYIYVTKENIVAPCIKAISKRWELGSKCQDVVGLEIDDPELAESIKDFFAKAKDVTKLTIA